MNSPVSVLTNLIYSVAKCFPETKLSTCWSIAEGSNINPYTTFQPSGYKYYKTISSYVSCAFIKIWSTWEVWRALKKLSCSPNFPCAAHVQICWSLVWLQNKLDSTQSYYHNINRQGSNIWKCCDLVDQFTTYFNAT